MRPFPDLEVPLSDDVVSLRHFTLEDVTEVTRALQDQEIVRWTASLPTPYAESDAQGWIERHAELWNAGTTAQFAIVEAAGGALMGNIYVIVAPYMLGPVSYTHLDVYKRQSSRCEDPLLYPNRF